MVAKWSGILSTTEPRNDIGILNVRQGNKNSEIAEFQIIENNKPYDLTGFTVLFCASFGMNQVEKPASVINAKEGKISYTFDDDAMQQVGRNKGYFSIKRAEAIIDSTQEFEYRIQSSIYSRLIDAKSYIFRLNELMHLLEDFVTNSQSSFSTWFDSVKEILYGVDPGGNILRELIEARNGILGKVFPSLKARLDTFETETTAQFQQKNEKGYFYKIKEKINLGYKNRTSSEYYSMFDSLLTDSRMSKINLGMDQSGTLPVNLYIYEPSNYTNTQFITCAIHGWEHYSTLVMFNVLNKLILQDSLPVQFDSLRNTRILIIPMSNPWGTDSTSSSAIRRGNSQSVDLNRNFDYRFAENTGNFGLGKGASAFSEKETQHIKKVFDTYDIDFFLDLHNFDNTGSQLNDYLFNGNDEVSSNTEQLISWLKNTYSGANIAHVKTTNDSSANNYALKILGIPSMNIELIRGRYGADDDRKWLELMLNYLKLQAESYRPTARLNKNGAKISVDPQDATPLNIEATWTTVAPMSTSYKIDTDGIVLVTGYMVIEIIGTGTTTVTIAPTLKQERNFNPISNSSKYRSKPFVKNATGSYIIPINEMYPVRRNNGEASFSCEIILEGGGTAKIMRMQKTFSFIPSTLNYVRSPQHTN